MAKTTNRIISIFMTRDGDSYEDAVKQFNQLKEAVMSILEEIENPVEAYEYAQDELAMYSLEPDYLEDLIF